MKTISKILTSSAIITFTLIVGGVSALDLSRITNRDASAGLKETLKQGAEYAVSNLGRENGFFGNSKVHIPLPSGLKKAKKAMSVFSIFGGGNKIEREFEKLEKNLNTSAEYAVSTAKPILLQAINNITINDAKNILQGGDGSVTQFFRSKTSVQLQQQFLPIVKQNTAKLNVTEQYNKVAGPAADIGVIDKESADLDGYVTKKATDALFVMIAEKEKQIRQNPAGAVTSILRKVFGSGR